MQTVDFKQVEIKSGFFRDLQALNAEVSVYNIYKRFQETGRFHAMKCIRDDAHKPHVFWDSDIAKWLESVANILAKKEGVAVLIYLCDLPFSDEIIHDSLVDSTGYEVGLDGFALKIEARQANVIVLFDGLLADSRKGWHLCHPVDAVHRVDKIHISHRVSLIVALLSSL